MRDDIRCAKIVQATRGGSLEDHVLPENLGGGGKSDRFLKRMRKLIQTVQK